MNFSKAKAIRKSLLRPVNNELEQTYPHNLQFFPIPPDCEVSLQELQDCCGQRLAILQTFDEVTNRGLKGEEWRTTVFSELRKQDLKGFRKLITNTSFNENDIMDVYSMRKWDHISHYILRLAYCETEDKRRWFISREIELFRFRWSYLSTTDRQQFLEINKFNYERVSDTELSNLGRLSDGMVSSTSFYKVPFAIVSDLVRLRRVFLHKGIAYITGDDMISVVISSYRTALSRSLVYASKRLDNIAEDERISSLLRGAGKSQRDVDYASYTAKGLIDISNIDALAEMSFPLCMQKLHHKLRKDHHLKHFARLQYILFLKGIGVTLEDALKFWRSEFTKKMDEDKFEKQYAYNVKHSYGKVGKMANYAPQSCIKIINSSVAAGEAQGCPFKHEDQTSLKKSLIQNGLSTFDAQEVLEFVKKGHYQIACGLYFQKKHGVDTVIINHPNHYFDESQMVINNRVAKKEETKGGEKTSVKPQPNKNLSNVTQMEVDVWGNDSGFDFSAIE